MRKNLIAILFLITSSVLYSQNPVLIGYWQNWNDSNAPYVPLNQVDSRYAVLCVSFAVPNSPSDMTMNFVPDGVSQATLISQIQALQNQGKKILLSIGGANTSISLDNITNRDLFVSSMTSLIQTYGFDGIDIDIEHGNSILASGTISNPISADVINLIAAINQIRANYYTYFNRNMMLTFAPETAYVQGGMSAFGGIWGGYLPIINAFRNELNYIHVQLYNSGSMYGIDGNVYNQGTSDFIVAMTDAMIHGFSTSGGFFQGLTADKVVVGLPSCPSAAGGGFVNTATVESAIKYLRGVGPKPAAYTLSNPSGYANLGGMMTWSINWDKVTTCNTAPYKYAQNYIAIFGSALSNSTFQSENRPVALLPNPCEDRFRIYNLADKGKYSIINSLGQIVQKGIYDQDEFLSVANLPAGLYYFQINNVFLKLVKK